MKGFCDMSDERSTLASKWEFLVSSIIVICIIRSTHPPPRHFLEHASETKGRDYRTKWNWYSSYKPQKWETTVLLSHPISLCSFVLAFFVPLQFSFLEISPSWYWPQPQNSSIFRPLLVTSSLCTISVQSGENITSFQESREMEQEVVTAKSLSD